MHAHVSSGMAGAKIPIYDLSSSSIIFACSFTLLRALRNHFLLWCSPSKKCCWLLTSVARLLVPETSRDFVCGLQTSSPYGRKLGLWTLKRTRLRTVVSVVHLTKCCCTDYSSFSLCAGIVNQGTFRLCVATEKRRSETGHSGSA